MIKQFKHLKRLYDNFDDGVELPDGSTLGIKVNPKLSKDIKEAILGTEISLEYSKDFIEDNVEITVNVNGEIAKFVSPGGTGNFKYDFKATKRF